jgi:hypothetical protein
MSKIVVLAAGATGYVLGAKAGRERYEQIKEQFDRVWNDPTVQKAASNAHGVVAEKAPAIKDKASTAAGKAAHKRKRGGAKPKAGESRSQTETPSAGSSHG